MKWREPSVIKNNIVITIFRRDVHDRCVSVKKYKRNRLLSRSFVRCFVYLTSRENIVFQWVEDVRGNEECYRPSGRLHIKEEGGYFHSLSFSLFILSPLFHFKLASLSERAVSERTVVPSLRTCRRKLSCFYTAD